MKTVKRLDVSEMGAVTKTPAGFLKVPVYVTRVGVLKYTMPDGTVRRELRHPEDVFDEASIESLKSAPMTLRHPPVMVTPDNAKEYMRGYLTEQIQKDDKKVGSIAVISHQDAINAIEAGMRQVSCGYQADLYQEDGEYEGEKYDFRQKNIRYNHVAIVDRGRAGPEIALRLDADDNVVVDPATSTKPKENPMLVKVMLGGKEFEVEPALAEALKAHMSQMEDGYKSKQGQMSDQMAAMGKEKDQMQAKMDSLEEQLKTRNDSTESEEKFLERVRSRVAIEKVASYLGVEKTDSLKDGELKKAVIAKHSPKADLTGKSEHYIDARFDSIAEEVREAKDFGTKVATTIVAQTKTDSVDPVAESRKKMIERDNSAWNAENK